MSTKITKTFTLQELSKGNIDYWVEAMSEMADTFGTKIEGYRDDLDNCPAEYEPEFTEFAKRNKLRFSAEGKIVAYELEKENV